MTGILELPEEDAKKSARKLEEALENYAAGKYNNAVANCLTALRLYRTNATEIYFVMGLAHLELGTLATEWDINDTIVACENFSVVISRAPECAAAYYYRGKAILRWGNNYRRALADFEKVLELEPENVEARECCEICRQQLE